MKTSMHNKLKNDFEEYIFNSFDSAINDKEEVEKMIDKILKENLIIKNEHWNITAQVADRKWYPAITLFTCDENGEIQDCVGFTEIDTENKKLVTYGYDLNSDNEDICNKTVHADKNR